MFHRYKHSRHDDGILEEFEFVPSFIIHRDIDKEISFPNSCRSLHFHQYIVWEKYRKRVFKDILHINLHGRWQGKFSFSCNGHQGIELVFTKVLVVYVHIAVHFPELHTEIIGIVIDQVHTHCWLAKAEFIDLEIPEITIIEALWFCTTNDQNSQ